jgi:hypothetical protein
MKQTKVSALFTRHSIKEGLTDLGDVILAIISLENHVA